MADRVEELEVDSAAPRAPQWRGWERLQAVRDAMRPQDLDGLAQSERDNILLGLRELAGQLALAKERAKGRRS